jgi:predicted Zn-dependent protease
MLGNISKLVIVRVGNNITFSSLKTIGDGVLESFHGRINQVEFSHHNAPVIGAIDAQFLTMVLHEEYGGHTLGITDADLRTEDDDEFYNSIFGGKNPRNDVAVVSTKKLCPRRISNDKDYELFIGRTLKVSLHEVGHNLGLTDHPSYRTASDGSLCPMSRGEFNKFGHKGYVRAVIDGRGMKFCDECTAFLNSTFAAPEPTEKLLEDRLVPTARTN